MSSPGTSFSLSQLLTGAVPTTSAQGQLLTDLDGVTIVLETATPASQTLSGAGTLDCYAYDPFVAAWYLVPDLQLTVPSAASGLARVGFGSLSISCPRASRLLYVPNGVTVSAGTTVTVYQLGMCAQLAGQYGFGL